MMMVGRSAGISVHEEIAGSVADNVLFVSRKVLLIVNIHGSTIANGVWRDQTNKIDICGNVA